MKPGFSATLGVSQGTHTPYARVTGRAFGMVTSKKLDLSNPLSLAGLLGIALYAGSKQAKRKPKAVKAKAVPARHEEPRDRAPSTGLLSHLL